jgi:hypothetical protein
MTYTRYNTIYTILYLYLWPALWDGSDSSEMLRVMDATVVNYRVVDATIVNDCCR